MMILGTRGSDLAVTQANMVKHSLSEKGIECEIRIIKTIGDKRPDLKLSEFSATEEGIHDKGIFTRELEEALLAREIDFAVHSLKDVPTELASPFEICATLPRAAISDVILSTEDGLLDDLNGKTVATSSVRRARLLRWNYPGVKVVDIRGNVPTRIRKLIENPDWDAIVLARAGIERLGFYDPDKPTLDFEGSPVFANELPIDKFLPAASQGAVAMEVRCDNEAAKEALARINHPTTFAEITAERSFLAALQAGCQTPVGVVTKFVDGENLEIKVVVFSEEEPDALPRTGELTIAVSEAAHAGIQLLKKLSKVL